MPKAESVDVRRALRRSARASGRTRAERSLVERSDQLDAHPAAKGSGQVAPMACCTGDADNLTWAHDSTHQRYTNSSLWCNADKLKKEVNQDRS
jgi:hypothetical protein